MLLMINVGPDDLEYGCLTLSGFLKVFFLRGNSEKIDRPQQACKIAQLVINNIFIETGSFSFNPLYSGNP